MAGKFFGFFQQGPKKPLGGRYKAIRELGAGGFGKTYLAEDLHLPGQPICVVKQLKPQVSDAGSLQTARRLFDTEAKVLYQLGSHDQIPRLLAHFEDEREFYLAQELIEGEMVSEELVPGQPWSEAKTVAMLQDILQALAFVHQQSVIHRDLKPSNLIRRKQDGKIVLIDFGAVKEVGTQLVNPQTGKTNLTVSIGTQGYMASEQLSGNPRFSSDVYSVGKIAIQALTGVYPRYLTEDAQTGEVVWRDLFPHPVTPELADIIDHMVRYDFRSRYPTATEALAAVQQLPAELLQSDPPAAATTSPAAEPSTASSEKTVPLAGQVPDKAMGERAEPGVDSAVPTVAVGGQSPQPVAEPKPAIEPKPVAQPKPTASEPTVIAEETLLQKFSVKPWQIFAFLGALGALVVLATIFSLARTILKPQTASQTAGQPTSQEAPAAPASPSPDPQAQAAALLGKADSSREAGDYQAALDTYDNAIALNPDAAEAHWGRCYSLNQLSRHQEGLAACDRALALNPNDPNALWSKGTALQNLKQPAAALKLYNQAIAQKPDFAEAWNNKGTILMGLGRHNEAFKAYDKAVQLKPDLADAWVNRGAALWSNHRDKEAIDSIKQALKIDPNHATAKKLYEQAQKELGGKKNKKDKKGKKDKKK